MRYSLIDLTVEGQDTKLAITKFEKGRNFANKLWNAARFAIMKVGEGAGDASGKAITESRGSLDPVAPARDASAAITECLWRLPASTKRRARSTRFTWNRLLRLVPRDREAAGSSRLPIRGVA
jgi:valyl-tRNA synthetase